MKPSFEIHACRLLSTLIMLTVIAAVVVQITAAGTGDISAVSGATVEARFLAALACIVAGGISITAMNRTCIDCEAD